MKKCIINQYFGIGDILFVEPICRHYWKQGYEIVFPVISKYLWIQDYIPYINFVDKESYNIDYECQTITEIEGNIILPLRWSKEFMKSTSYKDTMRNKYLMFGFDLEKWRDLTWIRHRWKEDKLMRHLGIEKGEKYNLINKNYYSFENKSVKVEIKNDYKNIEMGFVEGFTLIDWGAVIENATEIHTVNTSILYLMEKYDLKAKEIHYYSRGNNGIDFKNVDYLFSKKYILHK